jgi:sugar lactone lactonase YvrE
MLLVAIAISVGAPPAAIAQALQDPPRLELVATSPRFAWNGVAIANDGRLFANMPRWDEGTPSVVRVDADGTLAPYPGGDWNTWRPGDDPRTRFVSVNALHVDRKENHLWVVDSGTPEFGHIIAGGPKLVEIDLAADKVVRVYPFDKSAAPATSYLNDMRVQGPFAFVTESGTGALLVLDRRVGSIRRLLAGSRLTKGDPSIIPVVEGRRLVGPDGRPPTMQVDELELSADGRTLFFMVPTGPNLYRVQVADLLDKTLSDEALEKRVAVDRHVPPVGGIVIDQSDTLYLSEIETHSIRAIHRDGTTRFVITDPRLDWPDAYSIAPDGTFYVVASQVDQLAGFHGGVDARKPPYFLFKFRPPAMP